MTKPDTATTMSDDYRKQLTEKHQADSQWGNTGIRHYPVLLKLLKHFGAKSVIDYGCGKGTVGARFREDQQKPGFEFADVAYYEYDPGIPEKMHDKSRADILFCTDVMEHIEPDYLQTVLADMAHRTLRAAFILISCVPAVHRLPDGRNAHLIIEHPNWWVDRLNEHFVTSQVEYKDGELYALVVSKEEAARLTAAQQPAAANEAPPEAETKKKLTETDKLVQRAQAYMADRKYTHARALLSGIKNKQENPEALFLLGKIWYENNDLTRAAQYFLEYGQIKKAPEAYRMAGISLSKIGQYDNALKCLELDMCTQAFMGDAAYREALMLGWNKTLNAEKSITLYESRTGQTPTETSHYIDALLTMQDLKGALAAAEKATQATPDNAELWSALERAHASLKHFDKALEASQKCVELEPDNAVYECNLGLSYLGLARLQDALASFTRTIELDPLMMAAYLNRSTIRRYERDYGTLAAELNDAYEIEPSSPDVHYALGVNAYRQEDYDTAFPEIEWYWHKNTITSTRMPTSLARWYGEDITDKTLLFFADQGIGDIIMMLRYIPMIIERHNPKKLLVHVSKKMQALVKTAFPELFASGRAEIFEGTPLGGNIDRVVAATTLPHVMGTTLTTIPAADSYIKKRDTLDYKTGTGKELVVGISWYTKSLDAGFIRSLKLMDFAFLGKYDTVRFIDLQYGDTAAERADAASKGFEIFHDDQVDSWAEMQPFVDQIAACDLVVSIDNTTVHAAGALGVPCWVILPQESYWRWPIDGAATPWYQSLRLFRQQENQSYESLFKTVDAAFSEFVKSNGKTIGLPSFTPLFPAKQKPAKTAVIINDTTACYTWAHNASMEGLKADLTAKGYAVYSVHTPALDWLAAHNPSLQDFDDPKYLAACRYRDPTTFYHIEHADEVIINGDGMLTGLTDTSLRLLYLAYIAKQFYGCRVSIINHSCFPEGGATLSNPQTLAFYHKVYSKIDACIAREQTTCDLIKSIGVPATMGLDTALLWLAGYQEKHTAPAKTKTAILTAGPGYDSFAAEPLAELCKKLQKSGITPIILKGAKWHHAQEDMTLATDLAEFIEGGIKTVTAKSRDEFMEYLSAAEIVYSGFYHICLIAHAMGIRTIPVTTGSNAVTMQGLAKSCGIAAPLWYEDPALVKKLKDSITAVNTPHNDLKAMETAAKKSADNFR